MTVTDVDQPAVPDDAAPARPLRTVRLLAIVVLLAGVVMVIGGGVTWFMVQDQLADENITVSEDAERFAGDPVDGPFTAYQEAQTIEKHALEASGGKTYAELDRDDPKREVVMTGSFLRASLFTSVVSFGVAAMAMGVGVVLILVALALMSIAKALAVRP